MDRRRFLTGLLGTALIGPPLVRALAAMPFSNIALSDWVSTPKIPAGATFWVRHFFDNERGIVAASLEYPAGNFRRLTFGGAPQKTIGQRPMGNVNARTSYIARGDLVKLRILHDLEITQTKDDTIIVSKGGAHRDAG